MSWDFVAPLTEQKKLERVSDAKTSPDAKKKDFQDALRPSTQQHAQTND